jgi:hypothetical protein
MTPDPATLQLELEALLEARGRDAAQGRVTPALTDRIAAVARQLGLDPAELADVTLPGAPAPARSTDEPTGALVGEFVVLRRFSEVMLLPFALVLALLLVGVEQAVAGVGLAAAAALLFVMHEARRVARIRIDEGGELSLPGRRGPLAWSRIDRIEFAYRHPAGATSLGRAAQETVDLRFHLGGEVVTLARGPLWRTGPRREPIAYVHLERWLTGRAREAGMTIERRRDAWTARRA